MYRTPAEIPRARLPLLDEVTIKTPCREPWEKMDGTDRVRFCNRCTKNVYNLSAMSHDEAEAFLATHLDDETPCIRLFRRPDGTVITSECSEGARRRHMKKVAFGAAAGVCAFVASTAALASVHLPHGKTMAPARASIDVKRLAANAPMEELVPSESFLGRGFTGDYVGPALPAAQPPPPPAPRYQSEVLPSGPEWPAPLSVSMLTTKVTGALAEEVVLRTLRVNLGRVRVCYEDATLSRTVGDGAVRVKLMIARDGGVIAAQDGGSDLADRDVVRCIVRGYQDVSFPAADRLTIVSTGFRFSGGP